jgi:hypothetical protein
MVEKFLVASEGTTRRGVEVAVSTALKIAEMHGCNLTILVPALNNARNTSLTDVLPKAMVKELAIGRAIKYKSISITMKSPRNFEPVLEKGVILAVFATLTAVKKVEKAASCVTIVVHPWQREQLSKWENKERPVIIELESQ